MLTKTEKSFCYIFLSLLILELLCISIESLSQLHYITKPLLLIALFVFFVKHSKHIIKKTKNYIMLALLFSWCGDIFLMFVENSPHFFMAGLISFLIAHVMYVTVFNSKRNKTLNKMFIIIPLLIYASILFYFLKGGLNELLVPVIIYMLVILTMVTTAYFRKGMVNLNSFNLVFLGAILFLFSDSLIAINKFYINIPLSQISIMITYGLAQLFIIIGLTKE